MVTFSRISVAMCVSKYIQYTCGCKKEMEFVQCDARAQTNAKCPPVQKEWGKDSTNYCPRHLVKPDSPVKYLDQDGN
ncbi:hypothetical protein CERZMDRAFT_100137 [Cercospora zeae-maydis SCOH1-5]|uniref:Uncharacterized protein n=1 Tax=Cercospora zeae-maydis SCOH1-5 TaxID=717836 RepID=A0A6A6F872_9PEZI|nr:hypothetical protein CERZMDRAFT_100137 [Cercospora zeae-maydis SCOH1-5]